MPRRCTAREDLNDDHATAAAWAGVAFEYDVLE